VIIITFLHHFIYHIPLVFFRNPRDYACLRRNYSHTDPLRHHAVYKFDLSVDKLYTFGFLKYDYEGQ